MRIREYFCAFRGFFTSKDIFFLILIALFIGTIQGCWENMQKMGARNDDLMLPKFPWPAPQASSKELIETELLTKYVSQPTLGEVNSSIVRTLSKIGYTEFSYFAVPKGFALVTRIEKINGDGSPKQGLERWETNYDIQSDFSLERYLKTLFTANKGFYRIVVFIISPNIVIEGKDKIIEEDAIAWLRSGGIRLPPDLAHKPFSGNYNCAALIYEFEKTGSNPEAKLISPGKLLTRQHLAATGFYQALGVKNAH